MKIRRTTRAPELRVTVNNNRCHRYGICQAEADGVFLLAHDGRLRFDSRPPVSENDNVLAAARYCPMQAITVERRAR
ncbi:MAG TPA: ferredoxin [Pseudonocardiaceae bacterium]|nr:ferredoxin [Pseudonocardiaceae bacterium]